MNTFSFVFIFTLLFVWAKGQLYSASDRSPQELALLEWTSGLRMAYCQDMALTDLVDPFREALAKMANRHCRNATACRLEKPVQFTIHHVFHCPPAGRHPRRKGFGKTAGSSTNPRRHFAGSDDGVHASTRVADPVL
uniref:Secreted protein n=1 Tax=Panagrolaimus sp. JU765 TaxID=591449 RepID=A0AC34QAD9_9BILA